MGFQHPNQRAHMMAGRVAAASSTKTPAHLRIHQKKLSSAKQKSLAAVMKTSKIPSAQKQLKNVATDSLPKLDGPQNPLYSGLYGGLPK